MRGSPLLFVALLTAACAPAETPDPSCRSDEDCPAGLQCLNRDVFESGGGACRTIGTTCTTTCAEHSDCDSLGSDFVCVVGCESGAPKRCAQGQRATTDLPAASSCSSTEECGSGLSCLDFTSGSAGQCSAPSKMCSTTCQTDQDCAPLGATFKCFQNCGQTTRVCGKTA